MLVPYALEFMTYRITQMSKISSTTYCLLLITLLLLLWRIKLDHIIDS